MTKIFYALLIISLLIGCTNNTAILEKESANVKEDLEKVNSKLSTLSENDSKGKLVHQVYFSLKADLNEEQRDTFMNGLEKLSKIESIKDIIVEARENVGDESRALTEFDVIMQLTFDDKTALNIYTEHEFHLQIKKEIGRFLGKPPMTFDYVIGE